MFVREIKINKEIMKCYKLKNIYERLNITYNGLCMFEYIEPEGKEDGEWGNYSLGKRNGFVATWSKIKGCTRGNYVNNQKEGEVLHTFINGNLHKCNYKNGIKEGPSLFIWKNGGTEERYYKNGLKNGKAERKFINGCKEEVNYINDVAHGKSRYYYPNGTFKERIYEENRIIGNEILYSSEGQELAVISHQEYDKEQLENFLVKKVEKLLSNVEDLLLEIKNNSQKNITYKEKNLLIEENINNKDEYGRKQGKWKEKIGNEIHIGEYLDNKKNNIWVIKTMEGKKLAEKNYDLDTLMGEIYYDDRFHEKRKWKIDYKSQKQGEWIYDKRMYNGLIREVIRYEDDIAEGEYTSYYSNGNIYEKGFYKNGLLNGYFVKYDFYNEIISEGVYKNGKKEGEWYENDEEINYKDGLKIGIYITYYKSSCNIKEIRNYGENGKSMISEIYYKSGEIKSKIRYIYENEKYVKDGTAINSKSKRTYFFETYEKDNLLSSKEIDINSETLHSFYEKIIL